MCPGGGTTTLTGRVLFPNGTLPVAGAQVFVPIGSPDSVPATGTCGECIDGAALAAHTSSGVDGTFTLTNVPSGMQSLVIRKGKFQRVIPLNVTACATNTADDYWTRLPRDASEGTLPRIAVITGTFDHMESVLDRLGLAAGSYDLVQGQGAGGWGPSNDEATSMFRDRVRLMGYDIVFVNCGADIAEMTPIAADVRDNIRAFVEAGGRLFTTDWAYDLVEALGPAYIDFNGGGSDGMGPNPEVLDAAERGAEILGGGQGTVHDDQLSQWLGVTGSLIAPNTVELRGLIEGWAVVDQANMDRTKVWVSANVSWGEGIFDRMMGVKPMTVTFEAGCGRALFTSYHTVEAGGFGGPTPTGELTAQEKILAYLVLEIGTCVEENVPTLW